MEVSASPLRLPLAKASVKRVGNGALISDGRVDVLLTRNELERLAVLAMTEPLAPTEPDPPLDPRI